MAKYHTSIRTLPVYNFYEILHTGKLEPLFMDEPDPSVSVEEMKKTWKEIYNSYCTASKMDNRHLKQIAKVEELKLKYYKIANLLELTNDRFSEVREGAKDALKGYNYIFRNDHKYEEELERLKRQLSSLKTKLTIEEGKLPQENKKEAVNLMKQAISLENVFDGKRSIDIYTMSVEKWIALWDLAKERIKAQKEARKR